MLDGGSLAGKLDSIVSSSPVSREPYGSLMLEDGNERGVDMPRALQNRCHAMRSPSGARHKDEPGAVARCVTDAAGSWSPTAHNVGRPLPTRPATGCPSARH